MTEVDSEFFTNFLKLEPMDFVLTAKRRLSQNDIMKSDVSRAALSSIKDYVARPEIHFSSPLGQINQALEDADDVDDMDDDEIYYLIRGIRYAMTDIAENTSDSDDLIAEDPEYQFRGQVSENLMKLFATGPKNTTKFSFKSRDEEATTDWKPPSFAGLNNSTPLVPRALLADIKRDFDVKLERKLSATLSQGSAENLFPNDAKEEFRAQAKESYSADEMDQEYQAASKDDNSMNQFAAGSKDTYQNDQSSDFKMQYADSKETDFKESNGAESKYDEENDEEEEDDEDDDYDYEDEEDEDRPPPTMSAGLMRMLGMEVEEELATDWTPPSETGLDNSDAIAKKEVLVNVAKGGILL